MTAAYPSALIRLQLNRSRVAMPKMLPVSVVSIREEREENNDRETLGFAFPNKHTFKLLNISFRKEGK
jgi:hypothetical protein